MQTCCPVNNRSETKSIRPYLITLYLETFFACDRLTSFPVKKVQKTGRSPYFSAMRSISMAAETDALSDSTRGVFPA